MKSNTSILETRKRSRSFPAHKSVCKRGVDIIPGVRSNVTSSLGSFEYVAHSDEKSEGYLILLLPELNDQIQKDSKYVADNE